MYEDLAAWWPLLSSPDDYEEEAAFYASRLIEACDRPPQRVLELGSGGGNNASHMKRHFDMVLVDRSAGMLAVSRQLNPDCEHVEDDMRTVRLGREFDAVFVHDAICYITDLTGLRQVIDTAFVHTRPGGSALFAPDHVRETFRSSTDHGGHDGNGRSLRFLEWTWDPDPADTTYIVDYAFMLRTEEGVVTAEHDRHIEGLFARAEWLRVLEDVGFNARAIRFDHSELEPGSYEIFICTKPRT
jgi:SAM-dependent methyltransferase